MCLFTYVNPPALHMCLFVYVIPPVLHGCLLIYVDPPVLQRCSAQWCLLACNCTVTGSVLAYTFFCFAALRTGPYTGSWKCRMSAPSAGCSKDLRTAC